MKVQTVMLTIGFDPSRCENPTQWDWSSLVDVGPGCWIVGQNYKDMRDHTEPEKRAYSEQEGEDGE